MVNSQSALTEGYVGTCLNPERGPSVSEMVWLDRYEDVVEVFRSKSFVQGGGGLRDSAPLTGYGVLSLAGRDHFERRRIEAPLFRRPNMLRLEREVLAPALSEELDRLKPSDDGFVRTDLLELLQQAYCSLTCSFWGIDGVNSYDQRRHFVATVEAMLPGSVAEWAKGDHRDVVGKSLRAKQEFERTYFQPSFRKRLDLVKRTEAGELDANELPLDLLTVMVRAHDHFERWDADVLLREMILFTPGDTITRLIPHMVGEISAWVFQHPENQGLLEDAAFLRSCAIESLRLHPAVPFFVRKAVTDTVLSSGWSFLAGEYVVLNVRKASKDAEVFGFDCDSFNPYRIPLAPVKPARLAFGDGPHTCIGMVLSIGEAGEGSDEDEVTPLGLVTLTLRELFRAGVIPEQSQKRDVNVRDEYEAFEVVFAELPRRRPADSSSSHSRTSVS
jgi:cytochrome P450